MTISNATATSMSSYAKALLAAARPNLFMPITPEAKAKATVLQTANTAMFQMVDLMGKVRSLGRQAQTLSASNTSGVDALRTHVSDMLKTSASIASAAGIKTDDAKADPDAKPLTLDELRSTLSTMQTNLSANIKKLGGSMQKALSYDATGATNTYPTTYSFRG